MPDYLWKSIFATLVCSLLHLLEDPEKLEHVILMFTKKFMIIYFILKNYIEEMFKSSENNFHSRLFKSFISTGHTWKNCNESLWCYRKEPHQAPSRPENTVRYGNEVTCRPPAFMWYPSTPARIVRTNILPSTNGNGQVTSGFFARPMNLSNHENSLDSFASIISLLIHFSHRKYPSTAKDNVLDI